MIQKLSLVDSTHSIAKMGLTISFVSEKVVSIARFEINLFSLRLNDYAKLLGLEF